MPWKFWGGSLMVYTSVKCEKPRRWSVRDFSHSNIHQNEKCSFSLIDGPRGLETGRTSAWVRALEAVVVHDL